MTRTKRLKSLAAAAAMVAAVPLSSHAAPFASRLAVSGTNVSFILNEPADVLAYRLNGAGPLIPLDGTSKGAKSFVLNSPTDTFDIHVNKLGAVGYTTASGGTIAAHANGLSVSAPEAVANKISDDSNLLTRFYSPRGLDVSNDPSAPNFGVVYISNSVDPATVTPAVTFVRPIGDGLYALNADQSDAYGYGNTAKDPSNLFDGVSASNNSPFRVTVGPGGHVYTADWSDANANVNIASPDLSTGRRLLAGVGGPTTLPAGQNHGSVSTVYVEGSPDTGDLVVYTIDEDLSSAQFGGPSTDKGSVWRYNLGSAASPSNVTPTKLNTSNLLLAAAQMDIDRGADGKFYLNQNRSAGNEAGLYVVDATGTVLFNSLTVTRTLLGNPTAVDILRNLVGISVSPDQKWLAGLLNVSDVVLLPLNNGIPDLAGRMVLNTGTDVISGRDIAFDAAGNLHVVSSGQAIYRAFSPGGNTFAITSWNGTTAGFSISPIPEPATLGLAAFAFVAAIGTVRRKA